MVTIEGSTDDSAAKDVSMHIAAHDQPKYIDRSQVSEENQKGKFLLKTRSIKRNLKPKANIMQEGAGRLNGKIYG